MFSGIVQSKRPVAAVNIGGDAGSIEVDLGASLSQDLSEGASVAIDGVCLTATSINDHRVVFDVIWSTLARTTLPLFSVGRMVNVERSLAIGAENGGHDVSGHVDCTATIVNRISTGSNTCITFEVPADKIKYIFSLGFIAINGVSLTISDVDKEKSTFSVWLIPETLRRTNLEQLELRDFVNLEFHKGTQVVVDTINDAVERVLTHAIRNGQLLPEHVPALLNAVPTPALLTFSGGALSKK